MREYFIDTSFIVSLANKDDKYHNDGQTIFLELAGNDKIRFLISDYVIDEFLTLIARKVSITKSIEWGNYLFQEKWFDLIYTPSTIVSDAWEIYKKEKNVRNPLSFTDATIVAFCKLRKVDEILTFDVRMKNYN